MAPSGSIWGLCVMDPALPRGLGTVWSAQRALQAARLPHNPDPWGQDLRSQGAACSVPGVQRQAREAQLSPPALLYLPPETGGGDGAGEGPGLPRPSRHSEAGPGDTSVTTRFN